MLDRSFTKWPVVLFSALAIVVACGGSNGTSFTGQGTTGSVLCGPNGTNDCGNRKCDPNLGCVQCLTNADCSATEPICANGSCGQCATNANCSGATPACWPSDHRCHPACTSNTSCTNNDAHICNTTTGACVGCITGTDCAAPRPLCSTATASCVQCALNTDCPISAPRCFTGAGRCVQCLSNADCGASAPICDANDQEFRCRAGCSSDAQCSTPTAHCNTTLSECVQCLSNADCAGTITKICTNNGRCVECTANADCAAPNPACTDNGQCVQCTEDRDCPATAPKCDNHQCTVHH